MMNFVPVRIFANPAVMRSTNAAPDAPARHG
jgi:hypothetical protein